MGKKRNLHGIAGAVILVVSQFFMFKGIEPFATWFYYCAWWPYILIVDSLIYARKGNSLLMNRKREFLLMLLWSVFLWTFFEAVNLHLKNWYYSNVVPNLLVRWVGYSVAYATVLPGLFETTELLESLGLFKDSTVNAITVNRRWIVSFLILGIGSIVGAVWYPRYCFPLVWGGLIFLFEPVNYRWGARSLLRDWEQGTLRKFFLLLTAGLICGILWEFWNFWALTKWIYTVPFFEDLKLFEMPLAGFLGFPPFTVECYVAYNFISLFRHHRNWDEDSYRLHQRKRVKSSMVAVSFLTGLSFCLFTFNAIDRKTVNSYWPALNELQVIGSENAIRLSSRGIKTPKDLLRVLAHDQQRKELRHTLKISESDLHRWGEIAELSSLKGMGTQNADMLAAMGIYSVHQLSAQESKALYDQLYTLHKSERQRVPREEIVKVWIREAQRRLNAKKTD